MYPLLILVLLTSAGCRTGRNYPSPEGPRYAGTSEAADRPARGADTLRVVSFNIEFSLHVDSAIAMFHTNPALARADVLLLQEMNHDATRRIARALGFSFVYYPAIYHFRTHQDFGNAVVSRWPIVEDQKIVLPHVSRFVRTQRIATAATIRVGESLVRVYSTHLGTPSDAGPSARRDQLSAILTDAARYPLAVIGGDMNDTRVGQVAVKAGYAWPTERGPFTTRFGRWDHIFLKGLKPLAQGAGTVREVENVSDHNPVWATAIIR